MVPLVISSVIGSIDTRATGENRCEQIPFSAAFAHAVCGRLLRGAKRKLQMAPASGEKNGGYPSGKTGPGI